MSAIIGGIVMLFVVIVVATHFPIFMWILAVVAALISGTWLTFWLLDQRGKRHSTVQLRDFALVAAVVSTPVIFIGVALMLDGHLTGASVSQSSTCDGNACDEQLQVVEKHSDGENVSSAKQPLPALSASQLQAQPDHWTDPTQAHPDQWTNPNYVPTQADIDLIAKRYGGIYPSGEQAGREQDMKDALCAFYQNCQ
jgi:hypothetical protein